MTRSVLAVVLVLLLLGLVSRLVPLADPGGRLLQQWPTEDGYLMLTVSRNLALDRGMSTSQGEIPTNGVQPLATFLWSLCFRAVDGERRAGVRLVLAVETVLALLSTLLLYRIGRRALPDDGRGRAAAALAAAGWWASSVAVPHTMNGLETGLYVLLCLASLLTWLALGEPGRREPASGSRHARFVLLGLVLGATFWARVDAIFLVGSLALAHVALGLFTPTLRARTLEALTACAVSGLVALPWVVHNVLAFGSPMPISGRSESMDAMFGDNLRRLPAILAELVCVVLPVPERFEENVVVALGAGVLVAFVVALLLARIRRGSPAVRALGLAGAGFTACLAAYYGLFFGAGHFLGRYLAPAAPLAALATTALVVGWVAARGRTLRTLLSAILLGGTLLLDAALLHRLHRLGDRHPHFPVVRWVADHTSEEDWVAAVQTGTLGFFHDRTLNLDGKVNPWALARKHQGEIAQYVVAGPIRYLADWAGIAEWAERPVFRDHFRCIVDDPEQNLAVLERTSTLPRISVAELR